MDLSKIKTLIDFVGRSQITELSVTEKDVAIRIFRTAAPDPSIPATIATEDNSGAPQVPVVAGQGAATPVKAPIFGVLHRSPAPGQSSFVALGDEVEEGQTLFIIEAMKVFNAIAAPRAGRLAHLTAVDGGEVETGDLLAEIA